MNNSKWETLVAHIKLTGCADWFEVGRPRNRGMRCYVIEKKTGFCYRGMTIYHSGYIAAHNYDKVYDAVHNPGSKYVIQTR